jgi:hypothetical protein
LNTSSSRAAVVVVAATPRTMAVVRAQVDSVLVRGSALQQAPITRSQSVQAAQQTLTAQIQYLAPLPLLVAAKAVKAILLALEPAALAAVAHQRNRVLMAILRQLPHLKVTMAV